MDAAIIKLSSKGQIVIPASWRRRMDLHTGEELLALGDEDMLILKKVSSLKEDFEKSVKPIREKMASLGVTREDVAMAVAETRKEYNVE